MRSPSPQTPTTHSLTTHHSLFLLLRLLLLTTYVLLRTTSKALVRRPAAPGTIRFESSVGAGLPVIAALQRTIAAADPVSSISGSFSGTLGYVMSGLQAEPAS